MRSPGEIFGYADRWSAKPGESIDIMVSTSASSYRAELVRLRRGGPRPVGEPDALAFDAVTPELAGEWEGRLLPLRPGSFGVAPAPDGLGGAGSLTLQAWIYPTLPRHEHEQGILAYCDEDGRVAIALGLDPEGRLTLTFATAGGEECLAVGAGCDPSRWYLATATIDLGGGGASIEQLPVSPWGIDPSAAQARVASTPTVEVPEKGSWALATAGFEHDSDLGRPFARAAFNGKLDRPAAIAGDRDGKALAEWDLAEGIEAQLAHDVSGHDRDAQLFNGPLRAVTGHNWSGAETDFRLAPEQYGAIHFHDDDVADVGWPAAFSWRLPDDLHSGLYAARLTASGAEDMVPFVVRPAAGATAPIAFLAPTMTYMAYSNFGTNVLEAEPFTGAERVRDEADDFIDAHPEIGRSMYNDHADGSGIARVTMRRPMLSIRPWSRFWLSGGGGWSLSGDMFLIDWLEHEGYQYDVITDHDLHADGRGLLDDYAVVISGMHPEYVTAAELDAIEEYTNGGGRFMYLGGNGFYWVTTVDPHNPDVIELRRGKAGTRTWEGLPGEDHHSTTGELGGLWRHRGRAPQSIFGVGFSAQGGGGSAAYVRTEQSFDPRAAFIFEGVGDEELIGEFGNNMGGAAGDEIDRADFALGTPGNALLVATSSGHHSDFYQRTIEELNLTLPGHGGRDDPDVRADIVYFETPNGGAVFTTGSIDWTASLSHDGYDNNVARITANVLRRFAGLDAD